jgi:glycine hydroxymethyltransferase
MIMVTAKGLKKDPELAEKIDKAVFPGLQGGPHNHQTTAIAVALKEAGSQSFKTYGKQIVKNCQTLSKTLLKNGIKLVGNGTENHMILVDVTDITGPGGGYFAQYALETGGITVNKNTIPQEPCSPFYPSGARMGTPALTTRGMKEEEMKKVGFWIAEILKELRPYRLPENKEARVQFLKNFREEIVKNKKITDIRSQIMKFCRKFPVPGIR